MNSDELHGCPLCLTENSITLSQSSKNDKDFFECVCSACGFSQSVEENGISVVIPWEVIRIQLIVTAEMFEQMNPKFQQIAKSFRAAEKAIIDIKELANESILLVGEDCG